MSDGWEMWFSNSEKTAIKCLYGSIAWTYVTVRFQNNTSAHWSMCMRMMYWMSMCLNYLCMLDYFCWSHPVHTPTKIYNLKHHVAFNKDKYGKSNAEWTNYLQLYLVIFFSQRNKSHLELNVNIWTFYYLGIRIDYVLSELIKRRQKRQTLAY